MPVLIAATIGAGSGAVISGGIKAARGGSIAEVAKAASDGFMWGATGGSVSGGTAAFLSIAAQSGSAGAASVAVQKGLDIAGDTVADTARDISQGKKITPTSVAGSLAFNTLTAGNGNGSGKSIKNSIADSTEDSVRRKAKGSLGDSVSRSGSTTGTVWDNITPTQENYPFTNIPKSFEVEVSGQKMWVHGNATEHMYEDVRKGIINGKGVAYTNPDLYTQEIMSDFYGSLQEATKSGIDYKDEIIRGNWEFKFSEPRQAGQFPVVKHAKFNGWH